MKKKRKLNFSAQPSSATQSLKVFCIGTIIRIAPNEISVADPSAIKTIYSSNSGFTKVFSDMSKVLHIPTDKRGDRFLPSLSAYLVYGLGPLHGCLA